MAAVLPIEAVKDVPVEVHPVADYQAVLTGQFDEQGHPLHEEIVGAVVKVPLGCNAIDSMVSRIALPDTLESVLNCRTELSLDGGQTYTHLCGFRTNGDDQLSPYSGLGQVFIPEPFNPNRLIRQIFIPMLSLRARVELLFSEIDEPPPPSEHHSVAFSTSTSSIYQNVTSFSLNSGDTTGSDRFGVISLSNADAALSLCTALTWAGGGGAPAEVTGSPLAVSNGFRNNYAQMWSALAPATGVQALNFTFAGTAYGYITESAYTGVDQSAPTDTPVTATGSSTAPTLNLSIPTGGLGVDSLYGYGPGVTVTAGKTLIARGWGLAGTTYAGGSQYTNDTGTVAMPWTFGLSTPWGLIGMVLKQVSAGGATLSQIIVDPDPSQAGVVAGGIVR